MPDIDYVVHVSYLILAVEQYLPLSKSVHYEIAACSMYKRSGISERVDVDALYNNLATRATFVSVSLTIFTT